ncbi:phosphotransferase family protein [Actinomadura sp. 9N407]|uniref:phosphotransferase family protein n=1 Tax=Actinomadura sp. 9N407 TaxID=3375154 RepID=UPI0037B5A8D8
MTWVDLYERARARPDAAAGYYNHNIRIDTADGPVIVRIPIHGADMMDLRLWPEDEVLAAIAPYVQHAPRLLHASTDPPFQVHEFIDGDLLNDIAPRGTAVPSHVPADVAQFFVQLTHVPREKLPPSPEGWPPDGDTTAFAQQLSTLTQRVYDTYRGDYADLYASFGIPTDPLAPMDALWHSLTRRPFVCVHADVHRRNMIVNGGTSNILDWELALWGDPVYELAVHLHKMDYLPAERDALLAHWLNHMPAEIIVGWEEDLDCYLTHEQIKSAIVDSVRYAQLFAQGGPYPYPPDQLVASMTAKLNAARPHWDIPVQLSIDVVKTSLLA